MKYFTISGGGYFSTQYKGKEERTGYQIACPSQRLPKGGQRQFKGGDSRG